MKNSRHLSIPARLILLVLAVLLPAAGLLTWLIASELRDARSAAYAGVQALAQGTAADLAQLLRYDRAQLEHLAAGPLMRALQPGNCDPIIVEYAGLHPEFTALALRNFDGNVICSHLAQALQQRVLRSVPANATVAVIDRQNKLLLGANYAGAEVGSTLPLPPEDVLAPGIQGYSLAGAADGVRRVYAVAAVPGTGWRVLSGVPEDEVLGSAYARLVRSIAIGLGALALALALAHRIATSIARPVRELARASRRVANGDLGARACVSGPAEVESVARQFNRMLDVRARAEEALRESEERLHGIVHMAAEAIVVVDARYQVVLFNPTAESVFGCSAAEVVGTSVERFVPARLRAAWREHMGRFAAGEANVIRMGDHAKMCALRANGEEFPLEISLSRIVNGGKPLYSAVLNDISARRRDEERLNALANYDALTALPNRALFRQRLQRALVHAQRFNEGLGVLFVNLDRFKIINDTLGHEAGDRVLKAVAERLKQCLREVDVLACLGGDEFAVLIEQVTDTRFVGSVARKLLQAISELLLVDGQEYQISASIGISTYPADGSDATTLLRNADTAMHRAKERGSNSSQFYAAAMNAHSMARLTLETGLRHALERGEFLLHYQPKVDIASGRVTGMEALVRWMRPGLGMVSPADFIPLAEETGLIVPIGAWVLRAACERNRDWQRQGMPPLRVAVNLSARQFVQSNLVSEVARVLDASDLAPGMLELEITESMVMDNPERAIQTLRQLKSMGIALSIDDFGTGYSSLGYLKRFPIDNIKIDRSFIKDIPRNNDDATITRTIIDMTHNLRLKAVAEGVETQAQLEFLRQHGCDEIQGYYFSRPLAEDAFFALVQAQDGKAAIAA